MDWLLKHRVSYSQNNNPGRQGDAFPIAAAAAAVPHQEYRNDTDKVLMIQQLQNQVQMLRDQLDVANERTSTVELEQFVQGKEDDEDQDHQTLPPASKERSHYAARENPIKLPNGFIDGRSNAHAAFEEKCQLLRDYKKEFGHLNNIPTQKPGDKHYKVYEFVMKQRKFYSAFQRGATDANRITPERIHMLEEIGLEWVKKPEEGWEENYVKLKQYREKYGHCCLDSEESFDDPSLMGWVRSQRKIIKDFRAMKAKLANDEQDSTKTDNDQHHDDDDEKQPAGRNREQEQTVEALEGNSEKLANKVDAQETSNDSCDEKIKEDEHPKKKRKLGIPVYWTKEMYEKLLELKCPWLESFEEDLRARSAVKWGVLNSMPWYQRLQDFRAYVAKNGDGFVPMQPSKRTPLSRWVREQRRVYDAVQDESIQTCKAYESNFELLKSAGFVFDHEALRQEEQRLVMKQHEEKERERYWASSAGKLEAATTEQQKAQQALAATEKAFQDAKKDVQKVSCSIDESIFCIA